VLGDVGSFGGLFDPARVGAAARSCVASADGVGTKLAVAQRAGVYDTIGRDIVHHCIDDILVQGARPLFFLDYVAVGKMEPRVVSAIIGGCAEACRENGLALLGGETAEMPGLYAPATSTWPASSSARSSARQLLDGSRVRPGQVLLGLRVERPAHERLLARAQDPFEAAGPGARARPAELGGASVGEASARGAPLVPASGLAAARARASGGPGAHHRRRPGRQPAARAQRLRRRDRPPQLGRAGAVPFPVRARRVAPDEAYQVFNMGIGWCCWSSAPRRPA
jgi:hypothetical protein